jgi:hypothetical protein
VAALAEASAAAPVSTADSAARRELKPWRPREPPPRCNASISGRVLLHGDVVFTNPLLLRDARYLPERIPNAVISDMVTIWSGRGKRSLASLWQVS